MDQADIRNHLIVQEEDQAQIQNPGSQGKKQEEFWKHKVPQPSLNDLYVERGLKSLEVTEND